MFKSAEAGHHIGRKRFREEEASLRTELLALQNALRVQADFSVVLVFAGMEGAGRRETLASLYEWCDPRFLSTVAFADPDRDDGRPPMWRYWQGLPPKGRIGIFAGGWYAAPLTQRVGGRISRNHFETRLEEILRFETMLAAEGTLILKFWFHLSREAQEARLHALAKNPLTAWRVSPEAWRKLRDNPRLQKAAGHALQMTSSAAAPWIVVDGCDEFHPRLFVGLVLRDALRRRLEGTATPPLPGAAPLPSMPDERNVLSALDLSRTLDDKAYAEQLAKWQGRLAELLRHKRFRKRSLVLAFEGMDAAGKGGAVRHVAAALDPAGFAIVPVAAPSDEERARPWLWRFWRHVPERSRITIFDRSWYGRVLVERIEGFCREGEWMRAYAEINDFEHELVAAGAVVLKFWLQIDSDVQLARFRERESVSWKNFKITPEDWRNRGKWALYQQAAVDMIDRTSTVSAPWIPVEANDKNHARVKVLREICRALERSLER